MTYTYNPKEISGENLHRMRFELGDTLVDGKEKTTALSDEEYEAILTNNPDWKRAKLCLLEAICMKLSFQVDTKVDVVSYALSERVKVWQKMLSDMKRSMSISLPSVNNKALGDYYFSTGMHDNPRAGV